MKYGVSACLLGIPCKYNGKDNYNEELVTYLKEHEYVCVCPEVSGGLSTPRIPSEILADGRVVNKQGEDVSLNYHDGACFEVAKLKREGVKIAITQPRSPSCGVGKIYDGTFTKTLVDGDGIFVQMCKKEGISAYNCDEFLEKMKLIKK